MTDRPWRGVTVATTVPFTEDLSIDYDRFQEHVRYLGENGADGVAPNGSLGEYQVLTPEERARIVELSVEAAPAGTSVIPGVGAFGSRESVKWAEQAQEAGASAVLALPPNAYQASEAEVIAHYAALNDVGIPIVAYNNPSDTNVDLTPSLLSRLADLENVVAVKEFSEDVRRVMEIRMRAPGIDVLCGCDDLLVEAALMGAVGWIGGFPNSLIVQSAALFDLCRRGDIAEARRLYEYVYPAFRWDSKYTVVQSVKLSLDIIGRYGGPSRPPRGPLSPADQAQLARDMELALSAPLAEVPA